MAKRRVPKIGERVHAERRNGEFTVVKVDEEQGVADLQLENGTRFTEHGIPFGVIHRVVPEDVNQAAARIVREATERD